ncbi:MAG TPA: response regulator transcription factor [Anaerolineae bacterium]
MVQNISVLVVDDQPRARQSMKALLATWPNVKEIRDAVNGREAILRVQEYPPDLVVMDTDMPEMDGVQAARIIKSRWPQVKVVVLSIYPDLKAEILATGADAFVSKGEPPEELMATIAKLTAPPEQIGDDTGKPIK